MNVTLVLNIERELWGACSTLRKVNYGVYICSCSVRSEEYMCMKKYAFVYDSHFKKCINQNVVGISLIIDHMQLFVLWRITTEKKLNLKHALKLLW